MGTGYPLTNIKLVKHILDILNKPEELIEFQPNARLGHDFKYSLDIGKLQKLKHTNSDQILGNVDRKYFNNKLKQTIEHYCEKFNN